MFSLLAKLADKVPAKSEQLKARRKSNADCQAKRRAPPKEKSDLNGKTSTTKSMPSLQGSSTQELSASGSSSAQSHPSSCSQGSSAQSKPSSQGSLDALLCFWKRDFDKELYNYKLFCYEVNKILEKEQVSLPSEIQQKCKKLPAKMKKMYDMMVSKINDAENEIGQLLVNKNDPQLEIIDLKCKKVKGFLTSVMIQLKDYLAKNGLSVPK